MAMFKKSISVLCTVIAGLCSTFEQGISKEIVFKWGEGNSSSAPIELKEHVIFSLLQENIRHKVEETLLELGIPYTMQLDKNTLPTQFSLVFNDDESETVESLNIFSEKNHTYFLEEFDQIKETWIGWIQKQRTRYVDSAHTEFLDDLENILWEVSPEGFNMKTKS